MIWIASYPRSGNTFLRNIFFDTYGLESTSYPREGKHRNDVDYQITKTHELPGLIPDLKPDDFVIYLVRDGRDTFVSNSFYGKNFLKSEASLDEITYHQIMANDGAFFGGWSANVVEWSKRANFILRFEDLTTQPELWTNKIAEMLALATPDTEKIKSFTELKNSIPKYGSGSNKGNQKDFVQHFFRKGKIGSYQSEMTPEHQKLYWRMHGDVMMQLGYSKNGEIKDFSQGEIQAKNTLAKTLLFQSERIKHKLKLR